ncbi:MAG: VOC family protein, partial [Gemmataceae bacterium]|nr:VOC family protein [Gemmataceae bacterium]
MSFYCNDIERTVAELAARGVEFTGPVADHGYGLVTHFRVPGGFEVQLYEPRYEKRPAGSAEAGASTDPGRARPWDGRPACALPRTGGPPIPRRGR